MTKDNVPQNTFHNRYFASERDSSLSVMDNSFFK